MASSRNALRMVTRYVGRRVSRIGVTCSFRYLGQHCLNWIGLRHPVQTFAVPRPCARFYECHSSQVGAVHTSVGVHPASLRCAFVKKMESPPGFNESRSAFYRRIPRCRKQYILHLMSVTNALQLVRSTRKVPCKLSSAFLSFPSSFDGHSPALATQLRHQGR